MKGKLFTMFMVLIISIAVATGGAVAHADKTSSETLNETDRAVTSDNDTGFDDTHSNGTDIEDTPLDDIAINLPEDGTDDGVAPNQSNASDIGSEQNHSVRDRASDAIPDHVELPSPSAASEVAGDALDRVSDIIPF